jgi:hypothetical protein
VLGALVAFGVYYRGFTALIFDMVPRILAGHTEGSARLVRGVGEVASARTLLFFGPIVPPLAAVGLVFLWRRPESRVFLGAWGLTYAALLAARARFPDVFAHAHEVLFVAPFLCLTAGEALARLRQRGRLFEALALALWLAVALLGLEAQRTTLLAQFGYVL